MAHTDTFMAERPRLVAIATRVLADHSEAEDVAQQVWLRLHGTDTAIDNLPAWLTTVTVRLCLDRLRQRTPEPRADVEPVSMSTGAAATAAPVAKPVDPAEETELADTVGLALQVVLDRLTPRERIAFVLHDTFGFAFDTIAAVLDTTPTATRKLASRARSKVRQTPAHDALADDAVVDAFLAAARGADFTRLLQLLAPDVVVIGDEAAILAGTPERIEGRDDVATFFNGAAAAALPVFVGDRPGAAWFHRGQARVLFDFTVDAGVVRRIEFRADPAVLRGLVKRRDVHPRG
ncbi:MAG: sigma-70 family RNA polymerase sigma factor [Ornithinimicrobium sp.]